MNGTRRIVVAEARVPFARDGAELHAAALRTRLEQRGYQVDAVALPLEERKDALLASAAAWRLLDLSRSNARPIDLVIATRFPTYCVRHPRKVVWLIHQHRQAYELFGTEYSDFTASEDDARLRERLIALDSRMLGECTRIFTNSKNTAGRLSRFNGVSAAHLYHPPPLADRLQPGPYSDYVLVVARLEPLKRVDLAIRAMASVRHPLRLVIVGDGSQRAELAKLAVDAGVADRVELVGAAWSDDAARWYASALAVLYVPFDEDYGYVTLEAFLAARPVITARDSGGPCEFVRNGHNGFVVDPEPGAIAAAIDTLADNRETARRLGSAGRAQALTITWDGVIEQLVG